MSRTRDRREAGFSLVGALAGITIMLTLMAMAMPAWKYVMQDSREEELIFRGTQIVEAIERYQKDKRSLPVSFEVLVKGKYLRKAYADPMTRDGKWRLVHPGEALVPGVSIRPPGTPGMSGAIGGLERDQGGGRLGPGAAPIGPFLGVASRSKETSLRLFNGRSKYDEWIFAVGMPRFVGKPPVNMPGMPGAEGSPRPGSKPSGSPAPRGDSPR
jgi:type II secretory pathway pseudopilin PulG